MHKILFALVAIIGLYGCSTETVQTPEEAANQEATVSTTAHPVASTAHEHAASLKITSGPSSRDDLQREQDDVPNRTDKPCKHVQNILKHKENSFCPKYRSIKCSSKDEDCAQCQTYEKCLVREAQDAIEGVKGGRCRPLSKSDLEHIFENCKDEAFVM